MRRNLAVAVAVCLIGIGSAQVARAQQTHIGSYAAYQFDAKDPGMGGLVAVPMVKRFDLYPSATYYFVDTGSEWAVNADVRYRMPKLVYFGTGLNVARHSFLTSNSTDAGLNLITGVEAQYGRIRPFAEGRVILSGGSAFQLNGGVNMAVGR
jgi:hypothetical protein